MNTFISKLTPADLIAVITIVGGLLLKFGGADGTVGTLLTVIVTFYFGKRVSASNSTFLEGSLRSDATARTTNPPANG